jgi:hypothetical protein
MLLSSQLVKQSPSSKLASVSIFEELKEEVKKEKVNPEKVLVILGDSFYRRMAMLLGQPIGGVPLPFGLSPFPFPLSPFPFSLSPFTLPKSHQENSQQPSTIQKPITKKLSP